MDTMENRYFKELNIKGLSDLVLVTLQLIADLLIKSKFVIDI